MIKIDDEEIEYNELLVIDSDGDKHSCDVIGVKNDGRIMFIKEQEVRSGNAYCLDRVFYEIDKDEYLNYLGIAAKNTRLQRAISKGTITLDVSYMGNCFGVSSDIQCIIQNKEFSIFTADASIAEKYNFNRCDKFEYEKTIRINECDLVVIAHKDAKSGVVYIQQEFSPATFERWLDMLQ